MDLDFSRPNNSYGGRDTTSTLKIVGGSTHP